MTVAAVLGARSGVCAAALLVAAAIGPAFADGVEVSVFQPGGGFLVTDARSRIPIAVVIRDANGPVEMKKAAVVPGAGKAFDVQILGPGKLLFNYQPPDKLRTGRDVGEVRVDRKDGSTGSFTFAIELTTPQAPKLTVELLPARFQADKPQAVSIAATALSASALTITPSHGSISEDPAQKRGDDLELVATWAAPRDLPTEAPSHISFIAASSGPRGWAAKVGSLSVLASLRVSIAIDPGYDLVLEGSENKPAPVTAAADGKTVVEDVVRYGAPVRAFAVKGGKKKELSLVVPSGLVAVGTVAAIPGQNIADGGTGPTLILAVPPGPFGGEILWPEIEVQGAKLIAQLPVPGAKDAKVLVLERPRRAEPITVIGDGTPIGTIPFYAAHGDALTLSAAAAKGSERAAVLVQVRDAFGSPADAPVPRARIEGEELSVQRTSSGEYRVSVPAGVGGEGKRTITVDLAPPKRLDDTPSELVTAQLTVSLSGASAAVVAKDEPTPIATPQPAPAGDPDRQGWRFGAVAGASAGSTFGGALVLGLGALVEARLPLWDQRLAVRTGFEYFRGSGAGTLTLAGSPSSATAVYAGLVIPLEVGAAVVQLDGFELLGRAGLELRNEVGVLDVGTDRVGGGQRFGVSARVGVEGDFDAGPGSLCAYVGVGGIGASASGFSSDDLTFEGALTHFRLDVGYRFWF